MITLHRTNLKRAEAVHRQIPEFDPDYIHDRYVEKQIEKKNPYFIVCAQDDVDAGYMIGYDAPDSMYLWLNGTLPTYRRKGLFGIMLHELIAEARRRGHTKVTVKSYERFAPMLRALTAAGFERTGAEDSSILFARDI